MSIIKDIREAVNTRLDYLDDQLEALEAQLEGTREEALKRIQRQKENLLATLSKMEQMAADSASAAAEKSGDLHTAFDHLRVQLALGKAESVDLLKEQEKQIRHAIHGVEDRLEHAQEGLEEEMAKQSAAFVRIANKLRAEFEGAELQFALFQLKHREDVDAGKAALGDKLNELRGKLKSAGDEAGERFEYFEGEFGVGLAHIRKAFLGLGKGS